jgi:Ferritin-like domain
MSPTLTRAQLFTRTAKGGAALLVAGSALGQFVGTAAADPLPDADLAYARLLVATELLGVDFYGKAIASHKVGPRLLKRLKLAHANELQHYQSVGTILTGAGFTPAGTADLDYAYPRGAFRSEGSVAKVALELETIMLGAYLGAVEGIQTAALKPVVARIAASEAQHVAYLSTIKGLSSFQAFPNPMTIQQVSNALDVYTA